MAYPESKEEELSESQKEEIKEKVLDGDKDSEEIVEYLRTGGIDGQRLPPK